MSNNAFKTGNNSVPNGTQGVVRQPARRPRSSRSSQNSYHENGGVDTSSNADDLDMMYPDNDKDKNNDPNWWYLRIDKQCKTLSPSYNYLASNDYVLRKLEEFWNQNKCPELINDKECDRKYYENVLQKVRAEFNKTCSFPISEVLRSNKLDELKCNIRLYKIEIIKNRESNMVCENQIDDEDELYYGNEDKSDGSYLRRGSDGKRFWKPYEEPNKELPVRYEPCSCKEHQGNMYQRVSCTAYKIKELRQKEDLTKQLKEKQDLAEQSEDEEDPNVVEQYVNDEKPDGSYLKREDYENKRFW